MPAPTPPLLALGHHLLVLLNCLLLVRDGLLDRRLQLRDRVGLVFHGRPIERGGLVERGFGLRGRHRRVTAGRGRIVAER